MTRRQFVSTLPGVAALSQVACAQTTSYRGLTIPHTRPRLWWTPARLAQAQAWWNSGGAFTPASDAYPDHAFAWLMSGNTTRRDAAKNWLLNSAPGLIVVPPVDGGDRNYARWAGLSICACYDWLRPELTEGEAETCRNYWNAAFSTINASCDSGFPGPYQFANNYFWGFVRNAILWGIATIEETPNEARALLDWGLGKWELAKAYILAVGRGGVGVEGTQYGRYPFRYLVEVAATLRQYGRDLFAESDWFLQNALFLLHNLTPSATYQGPSPVFTCLPFGDDDYWDDNATMNAEEMASTVQSYIQYFGPSATISQHLQRLHNLTVTGTKAAGYVRSLTPVVTPSSSMAGSPLDFYASGSGYFLSRSAWDSSSALCRIMIGPHLEGVQHYHADCGDFLIWRKGRWLTRESTNYSDTLVCYGSTGSREVLTNGGHGSQHNVLLVNGVDAVSMPPYNGPPVMQRLESGQNYSYICADLTDTYRANIAQPSRPARDNPAVVRVVRECVWIRPLETLVVFDRVESASAGQAKTFILHGETSPLLDDANRLRIVVGDQTLRVTTVLPDSPSRAVIYEGAPRGQYRIDIEQSGVPQQYFLHVLQARDSTELDLSVAYDGMGVNHILQLAHPTLGYARVEFGKGISPTTGGGFAFSTMAPPTSVTAFRMDVQQVTYTVDGIVWAQNGVLQAPVLSVREVV